MRGQAFGDTPLAPDGVPAKRTPAEQFDHTALRIMRAVVAPWTDRLGDVELAVEEVPVLPANWSSITVPLASYVEAKGSGRPRLVLFRRPIEHRTENVAELETLLLTVIVEQLSEVLGLPVEDVLPGYEEEE
jgi:hypothetical protein